MPDKNHSSFFLGANTPAGFRSLFGQSFSSQEGWRVLIIKGGPGTGKSTLMRSVAGQAAQRGLFAEHIYCSSDPDSLDAVIIPSLKRAIYDGTAPHVLEPALPGACEQLIDLGQAWDSALLYERRSTIADLSAQCTGLHRQATHMLACADAFRERLKASAGQCADLQKIQRAAQRLCERFGLTRRESRGSISLRLASAVTPRGILTVADDYIASFGTVVPIYDRCFVPSGMLLSSLRELLIRRGFRVIECPCSQDFSRPEHILLPDEDICFTTRSDAHGSDIRTDSDTRAVHCERFLPESLARGKHPELTADRREMLRFTALASQCMAQAKAVHDRLEECYRDAMDFDTVGQLGSRAAEIMLSD